MVIHKSAEDYLESILVLKNRLGMVRSIDIVRELEFSKPSVSVAMKRLRENGYIEMDADGYITLLPPGEEVAQRICAKPGTAAFPVQSTILQGASGTAREVPMEAILLPFIRISFTAPFRRIPLSRIVLITDKFS